jgi:hypothetical protein
MKIISSIKALVKIGKAQQEVANSPGIHYRIKATGPAPSHKIYSRSSQ